MNRLRMIGVLAAGLVLVLAGTAAAQSYSELRGRVIDEQGAVMPGVTIVARNQESGQFREIVSGADGSYLMTALLPGVYEISAELTGFKRFNRRDVRLAVGQVTTIEVRLQVGALEETITVTGESPLVDVTSKTVGGNLEAQEILDTPIANRNTMSYMQLLPGVVAAELTSWGADSVSINGQPFTNTNFALDGGFNNDMWNGGSGGAQVRTPIEAVGEFQVQTSQYDAEFGWATGGVLNAISKQGTNRFRGSGFGFFQDSAITRPEFFTKQFNLPEPDNNQRQYGGTLGGPVVPNKAHFFVSLERVTQDRPVTVNIASRPEFNKNVVWKDRVWNALTRFDHQISSNHTWAFRWLQEWSPQSDQLTSTTRTEATREKETDVDWTYSGSINSVLGGTRVNTIRVHVTQEDVFFGNPAIFETGKQGQAALQPTLSHLTFLDQQSARASRRKDRTYGFDDTFAWFMPDRAGDHDVKFGLQYIYAPLRFQDQGNMNGTFTVNSDRDFDRNDPRTYPERMSIRVPGALDFLIKGHFIGFFAQDKWKVNRRTTVNLGLRYDVEIIPINERDNPKFTSAGDYPVDKNNVSPRVGINYAVDDEGRSVVRGGVGLFYQKTPFGPLGNFISNGVFADSFTVLFPATGVDPGPTRGQLPTDPFLVNGPVVNRTLLAQQFPPGTLRRNTGDVFLDNPDRRNAFSRQYTIGYERQLSGDLAVTVDYVRAENRDQLMRRNLNPPTRTSTARTAPVVRPNPQFVQNVWEPVNVGSYNYDALQLQLNKRFRQGYSYRVSYTRSRTRGNTGGNVSEIIATQVGDDLRLDLNEGPTDNDRPHILSITGTIEVPRMRGLSVSPLLRYMSGVPFTLTSSSFDLNRNGRFDDEFLAAGTYSGGAGVARNPFTTENDGGRNGALGPDFFALDLRVTYAVSLPGSQRMQVFGEVYNLTDRASFTNPGDDNRLTSFLDLRTLRRGNTSRKGQIGFRFSF
ncbi:MAG: TonB-dependent receptor [Acidobacteria bacterium]|nr:TonB-dependent receptor [Acidobacteriota bacterium]